jgi:hypothetical protein
MRKDDFDFCTHQIDAAMASIEKSVDGMQTSINKMSLPLSSSLNDKVEIPDQRIRYLPTGQLFLCVIEPCGYGYHRAVLYTELPPLELKAFRWTIFRKERRKRLWASLGSKNAAWLKLSKPQDVRSWLMDTVKEYIAHTTAWGTKPSRSRTGR